MPANRYLFTPMVGSVQERWHLSARDYWKIKRGLNWTATVTDLDTKRTYKVGGAACGAPCECAARVIAEVL